MNKMPHDDLFEGSTMTFGEHIEELRSALFQALAGLAVMVCVSLFFASQIVMMIEAPLKRALNAYYLESSKVKLREEFQGQVPPEMLTVIVEDQLKPTKLQIELTGLVDNLKALYPEHFSQLEAPAYTFTEEDLKDDAVVELSRKWLEGAQDEGSVETQIWRLLSSSQREFVEKISQQSEAGPEDEEKMVALLNDLATKETLHQAEPMQDVSHRNVASKEAMEQIRQRLEVRDDPNQTRRLNKLLLASVYPGQINRPRVNLMEVRTWEVADVGVQALNAHEAFMIWIKAAFIAGIVLSSPWIFYKIWSFVAAGLYPHERRYVHLYLPMSLLLFLAGSSMAFLFVFDYVLDFLFSFNRAMEIDPDPRIGEWMSFVLLLPLAFGVSFQLPLVMLFLQRIGLFSVENYLAQWRIAVLVIFVLSMFLTPADPVSMLLMAVPLSILYFGGIAMCYWMPASRNPFSQAPAYDP